MVDDSFSKLGTILLPEIVFLLIGVVSIIMSPGLMAGGGERLAVMFPVVCLMFCTGDNDCS